MPSLTPGQAVSVPDRMNALAGGREKATYVGPAAAHQTPTTMDGRSERVEMATIRYADGVTETIVRSAIRPL